MIREDGVMRRCVDLLGDIMDAIYKAEKRRIVEVVFTCTISKGIHYTSSEIGPLEQECDTWDFDLQFKGKSLVHETPGSTRKMLRETRCDMFFKKYMTLEDRSNQGWRFNRNMPNDEITLSYEGRYYPKMITMDSIAESDDHLTYLETLVRMLLLRHRDVKYENIMNFRKRYADMIYLFPYLEEYLET